MKTLLLIDSRPQALQVLSRVFEPHYRVVTATDVAHAKLLLGGSSSNRPDLIVLDVSTPDALDLANRIRDWRIPVVLLSQLAGAGHEPTINGYAADLITQPFDLQELLIRVDALLTSPQSLDLDATVRQVQIMRLMANGLTDAEIGRRLKIKERTVKWHIYAAMKQLNANSRPHLINIAIQSGLIPSQ